MLFRFTLLSLLLISTSIHADDAKTAGEKAIEMANKSIVNINTAELEKLLAENPKIELIDVRTQNAGRIFRAMEFE